MRMSSESWLYSPNPKQVLSSPLFRPRVPNLPYSLKTGLKTGPLLVKHATWLLAVYIIRGGVQNLPSPIGQVLNFSLAVRRTVHICDIIFLDDSLGYYYSRLMSQLYIVWIRPGWQSNWWGICWMGFFLDLWCYIYLSEIYFEDTLRCSMRVAKMERGMKLKTRRKKDLNSFSAF